MKTYTIYGQRENEPRFALVTLTGNFAPQVFDTLFDYTVGQFNYLFDNIFAEEGGDYVKN